MRLDLTCAPYMSWTFPHCRCRATTTLIRLCNHTHRSSAFRDSWQGVRARHPRPVSTRATRSHFCWPVAHLKGPDPRKAVGPCRPSDGAALGEVGDLVDYVLRQHLSRDVDARHSWLVIVILVDAHSIYNDLSSFAPGRPGRHRAWPP
jgi:hypothetical protein